MRGGSVFARLLGLGRAVVEDVRVDEEGLLVRVRLRRDVVGEVRGLEQQRPVAGQPEADDPQQPLAPGDVEGGGHGRRRPDDAPGQHLGRFRDPPHVHLVGEAVEAPEGILEGGGHERPPPLVADDETGTGQAVEGLADRPPADAELRRQLEIAGEAVAVAAFGDPLGQHPLELVVERERRRRFQRHGRSLRTL